MHCRGIQAFSTVCFTRCKNQLEALRNCIVLADFCGNVLGSNLSAYSNSVVITSVDFRDKHPVQLFGTHNFCLIPTRINKAECFEPAGRVWSF